MQGLLIKIVLAVLCVSISSSTVLFDPNPVSHPADHGKEAEDLIDEFWTWRLTESPEFATRIGMHNLDDSLEEFTEESFMRQKSKSEELSEKASKLLENEALSYDLKTSLRVLQYSLEAYIDGYKYRRFSIYNPSGFIGDWRKLIKFVPFDNEEAYRRLLQRYQKLPKQLDDQITLMRKAIELGTVPHRIVMQRDGLYSDVLQESQKNAIDSMFYEPFAMMPMEIPVGIRLQLKEEGAKIINEDIRPALVRLYDFLLGEYINHARPHAGVGSLDGGLEAYEAMLRWHTTTNLTSKEVHDIGLSEVQRIHDVMITIAVEDGFYGSLRDYVDHINQNDNNFFSTEAEMEQGYKDIAEQVRHLLPRVLHKIPKTKMRIQRFSAEKGPMGYYIDPSMDGSRPGVFYANVYRPDTKPKYDMVALTLHEAEPGHHLQTAYALETDLPSFRRTVEFRKYYAVPFNWPYMTAYSEGWGLYAEFLGESMGVYTDNLSLFGRYAAELFRAARLVVDTGIHAFNWTTVEAENYLLNHTTYPIGIIRAEVARYVDIPAQACAYKIGELKIKELRQLAENGLGEAFDQRDFHHEVLRLGAVPLGVLEESIKHWIEDPSTSSSAAHITSWPLLAFIWFMLTMHS